MSLEIMNMKEVVQRANENGINISEYTVRRAIRTGQLPCRKVGRTYLIAWNNVIHWLSCEDGCDNPPVENPEDSPFCKEVI